MRNVVGSAAVSQKVPVMVVLHSNVTINGNVTLRTFKARSLRAHILAQLSMSLLEAQAEVSFGIFRSSAVAFNLMSSVVVKHVLMRLIFRVGNSQKSLGDWLMTGIFQSARNCCETSDVWLDALS
jgi:hypothetical protein